MRHGVKPDGYIDKQQVLSMDLASELPSRIEGQDLGCYFCNDVVAPGNVRTNICYYLSLAAMYGKCTSCDDVCDVAVDEGPHARPAVYSVATGNVVRGKCACSGALHQRLATSTQVRTDINTLLQCLTLALLMSHYSCFAEDELDAQ